MSRIAEKPICSDEEKNILIQMSKSTSEEHRLVIRAKIVLMSAEGQSDLEISNILSLTANTVRKWRKRFISNRLDGIYDLQRSGNPPIYDKNTVRKAIFDILEKLPPKGQSVW
jgi:transposase